MRPMQRPMRLLAAVLLWTVCSLFGACPAFGQSSTSSSDQIDIFRNLSPDQQDAILQQLGGRSTGSSSSGGRADQNGRRRQDDGNSDRAANDQPRMTPSQEEEIEARSPYLKGDDWVIVEIDYQLASRPIPESNQQGLAFGPNSGLPAGVAQGMIVPGQGQNQVQGQNQPQGQNQQARSEPGPGLVLSPDEKKRLDETMELIRSKNPYQLSRDGVLVLPGFAGIALAGLTDDQATLRLKTEPDFRQVDIRLTRLPLKKTGPEALKPFGYDLFDRSPSTFAPVTNVPVPADYTLGSGDELDVQLYGNQNRNLSLIVGRDGRINFPELGPISVAGQTFNTVKSSIEERVARQMIGVRASVSMGDTRSIRVFVLGEAKRPGSYTISGLGTITSALYAAGGVKPIGSLRRIQLKRQGTLVRTLDLYDMLIRGDTTDDAKLLPGDVIFIPPVGPTVSADGELRRPAIYEIKNESSIGDLVQLAGGLSPEADTSKAMLTRIDESEHRVVLRVDLSSPEGKAQGLHNGDLLRVSRLRPTVDAGVLVQGHVFTSGVFAYRQGLRLTDVIHSVDELRPNADVHYLLIRRELPPDRRITVLSTDLVAALNSPGSAADTPLMPRDRITVFDLASGRDHVIQPVIDELRLQSSAARPSEVVHVDGKVKVPGDYPLEEGMRLSDLVRAGGGLTDSAYGGKAELTRYNVESGEARRTQLIVVDLAAVLRGDPTANVGLQPFDNLSIKEVPQWQGQESVTLFGEVRFPGQYAIRRGETLESVLTRAGGLTDFAFPEGSVFTREDLRNREQNQLDLLATRMQSDLTVLALQGAAANQAGAATALSVGQSLLVQLRAARAVGRLVIDLPKMVHSAPGSASDVILRNGDQLIVPRTQQEVTVIGEVQTTTSHLYRADLSRDDYISLSGGATRRADNKRIYIVRANGSVVSGEGSRWFQSGGNVKINPGDTVVVPLDMERLPSLPFWQAVTSIIYNVAISAAAVHSF